jgi:hypothetical protein
MTIPGIKSQRDARWASILLGYNTDQYYNIYHFGCAITGAANILWWATGDSGWTPTRVNDWLKAEGGYQVGGGLIIWGKLAQLMEDHGVTYQGYSTNLAGVNAFLAPESNFAIAQLKGPGFPMHFSAMPYVGQIADSWDALLKKVGVYTFVGAHMFTKIVPKPAPVPVPVLSPAPIQTPVAAPVVPVPSVEKPVANPQPEVDIMTELETPPADPNAVKVTALPPATDNAPEAPDTEATPELEADIQRTHPIYELDAPAWVQVDAFRGTQICDVLTDEPLALIAKGKKFEVTHYTWREREGKEPQYYLISANMATKPRTQGVDPATLRRTTAPGVDTIASKPADDQQLDISLADLGVVGRVVAKTLHAAFGDWHVFKIFKRNKE